MIDPIVTTEEGQLRGKVSQDYKGGTYYSFLGVPYAKAPIGELRFKAPEPAEPWDGIRDATCEGPECPSLHPVVSFVIGCEDNCLNLNLFTKELPQNGNYSLKPVMVWIHGGGFLFGSNKTESFGADYLITQDIVLLCINYRLGAFGFLCTEDPSLGVPGNAAMKDMVMALKWVQRNIKYFNGDPNNVTIFGESAGGAAVHYLYLSPLAKGLFHKAIIQSATVLSSWARGYSNIKEFGQSLGYKETDERKILEYLRSLPYQKIAKAMHRIPGYFHAEFIRPFSPVVEKPSNEPAFLTEDPIDIMKSGRYNQVPLIIGYNSREGLFFELLRNFNVQGSKINVVEQEIHHVLKKKKGPEKCKEIAKKMVTFYFGENGFSTEDIENLSVLQGDTQFVHGIHQSLCYHKLTSQAPIYVYRMSLETSINYYKYMSTIKSSSLFILMFIFMYLAGEGTIKKMILKLSEVLPRHIYGGTCHGDDVAYLFRPFFARDLEPGTIEEISVKRFIKLWTNFAKTGNPTPDLHDQVLNVEWKPVNKENHMLLEIGKELKMIENPDLERMKFWDDIYNNC